MKKEALLIACVLLFSLFVFGCTNSTREIEAELIAEEEGISVEEAKDLAGQAYYRIRINWTNCFDTDGGKNFDVKGTVYAWGVKKDGTYMNTSLIDKCVTSTRGVLKVREYYCDGPQPAFRAKACPCVEGACGVVGGAPIAPPSP